MCANIMGIHLQTLYMHGMYRYPISIYAKEKNKIYQASKWSYSDYKNILIPIYDLELIRK